jgi:hypothetical protein
VDQGQGCYHQRQSDGWEEIGMHVDERARERLEKGEGEDEMALNSYELHHNDNESGGLRRSWG